MATVYIYSSASASQVYTLDNGKAIRINGGANVADRHLWTPKGVRTQVSEDDVKLLEKHPTFASQVKDGYLLISREKDDASEVADKAKLKADGSAQKTKEEYKV